MWAELMDELREIHLGLKPKRRTGPGVGERLPAAYEKVMAKRPKVDASEAQPAIA